MASAQHFGVYVSLLLLLTALLQGDQLYQVMSCLDRYFIPFRNNYVYLIVSLGGFKGHWLIINQCPSKVDIRRITRITKTPLPTTGTLVAELHSPSEYILVITALHQLSLSINKFGRHWLNKEHLLALAQCCVYCPYVTCVSTTLWPSTLLK